MGSTMKCRFCNSPIDIFTSVCPACKKDQSVFSSNNKVKGVD